MDAGDATAKAGAENDVVIYQSPDGEIKLDVRLERETVWLTQAQMVELFGRDQSVISRHVSNVFKERELPGKSNMQKMHIADVEDQSEQLQKMHIADVEDQSEQLQKMQQLIFVGTVLRCCLNEGRF